MMIVATTESAGRDFDLSLESFELVSGDVVVVDFDPAIGCEIKKPRPAVVLGVTCGGRRALVVPVTSRIRTTGDIIITPPEGGLRLLSQAVADQARTIDVIRAGERLGRLNESTVRRIAKRLSRVFDFA